MAEFVFKKGTKIITYTDYDDIPEDLDFDHVIKFMPDVSEPPEGHTDEEHEELAKWDDRLQKLMEKERARSN